MAFTPAVTGLAVGLYGLTVLGWTRAVKLVSNLLGRRSSWSAVAYSPSVSGGDPLRRLGTPEDVALATLFVASESSSRITGATLDLAGGKVTDRRSRESSRRRLTSSGSPQRGLSWQDDSGGFWSAA
jgi:NAD(P)-dependent dehydrogenase (short-subunit alcohol dehydrogenase family)